MKNSTEKLNRRVRKFYSLESTVNSYTKGRFSSPGGSLINTTELDKIKYLSLSKDRLRILDIGVGKGRASRLFMNKNYVVGLDSSFKMLQTLRKEAGSIKCVQADIFNLPFKSEVFDEVISLRVTLHFNFYSLSKILKEIRRVLKKGGVFIFDIYNIFSLSFLLPYKRKWLNVYYNIGSIDKLISREWSYSEKIYAFYLPRGFYLHSPKFLLKYIHNVDSFLNKFFKGRISSCVYYKLIK